MALKANRVCKILGNSSSCSLHLFPTIATENKIETYFVNDLFWGPMYFASQLYEFFTYAVYIPLLVLDIILPSTFYSIHT